jgi:hypothetical protein
MIEDTISIGNFDDRHIKDVDMSSANYTIDMSSANYNYGNVTISTTGTSGAYLTSNGFNGTSWAVGANTSYSQPSLKVTGPADFDGDVTIQGHSILHLLKTIEDRLAILQEPSPEKLEKYAALKKAYDHYKTLERLIGED